MKRFTLGTNLLRAYMHGYFIDMRLYRKAKSIVEPLSLTRYKQNKVKETIDQQRSSRVQLQVTLAWINDDCMNWILFFAFALETSCCQ